MNFGLMVTGGSSSVKDGKVVLQNFHDYPVLRMNQAPAVETVVIRSAEPPGV